MEAHSQFPDAPLIVDGKELSQISIMGRVVKSSVNSSNFQYSVDDSTGMIDVRHYTDHDDEEESKVQAYGQLYN
jgi:hypothetical protein